MNIKKIIVDELPRACFMCPFAMRGPGEVARCAAKYNTRKFKNYHGYKVYLAGTPPLWCPLELESED